jgi:hypothetical protein
VTKSVGALGWARKVVMEEPMKLLVLEREAVLRHFLRGANDGCKVRIRPAPLRLALKEGAHVSR